MKFFPYQIVLCLLACLIPISASAQERALHSFVPSSAFAAMMAKPKAMLSQPAFELIPHEIIKVFGEKELGLDLLEIAEVLLVVDEITDPSMRQPPNFGVVVKFSRAQKLQPTLTEKLKPIQIENYKAYGDPREEVALLQLDDTTLVGGIVPFLPTLIEKHTAGELNEALSAVRTDDHLYVMIQLDPIRDLIKSGLPPKNQIPPPFSEFIVLPDLIKSISYRANFSTESVSELTIEANNEKDAQRIVRLIENAIELGKGAALTGLASTFELSPDYEEATVAYAERLSEAMKKGLKPKMDGNRLVYDLNSGTTQGAGLVNVSTVGILVAMLLPAVQQVREAARRAISMNNLRQIAIAMHNYESVEGVFPIQNSYDKNGKPLLSWRVHLLPYIEEEVLYNEFKLDEPWDSEHNIKLLDRMPANYQNPNFPDRSRTTYQGVSGPGTAFDSEEEIGIGFEDFVRGTSNTAILLETNADQAVEWTKPQDWEVDEDDPMRGLGRLRPGVFLVAMADGSAQTVSRTIDSQTWFSMTQLQE